jgi:hypothetical protein
VVERFELIAHYNLTWVYWKPNHETNSQIRVVTIVMTLFLFLQYLLSYELTRKYNQNENLDGFE